MKPIVRRGLGLLLTAACAAVWIVSSGMYRKQRSIRTCTGKETLDVIVKDSALRRFVAAEDVESWLDKEYRAYAGLPLDSVDLAKIESIVGSHSAVRSCEAWLTDDGSLHIELNQREPVIRFNEKTNGYYADAEGFIFPLQSRSEADVPMVEGHIPLTVARGYKGEASAESERAWLGQMVAMANYMRATPWHRNIKTITVTQSGDLVLTPREGKEQLLFGPPVRIAEKFSLIEQYYRAVKPSREEAYYASVDVRYGGQIVCRQKL